MKKTKRLKVRRETLASLEVREDRLAEVAGATWFGTCCSVFCAYAPPESLCCAEP